MDERLTLLNDRRLESLTKRDTPELARALVAFMRRRCHVGRALIREVTYIRLYADDGRINQNIRLDDWQRLVPYLRDEVWNPLIVATPRAGLLHPDRAADVALLPETDRPLYLRILQDLEILFPRDYPTSKL